MLLTASLPLWAYEFEHDGFYYDWLSETEVKLTYGDDPFSENYNYSGYITVPATIVYKDVTYNVTTIGKYAFAYCPNLTVLDIHENIQVLEKNYLEGNKQSVTIIMLQRRLPPVLKDRQSIHNQTYRSCCKILL